MNKLYAITFDTATKAEKLDAGSLGWGDAEAETLAGALSAFRRLAVMYLGDNQIGDAGLTSLSTALSNGALGQLEALHLEKNQIGDQGLEALAEALKTTPDRPMGVIANLQAC